jgi:hypothetical protein
LFCFLESYVKKRSRRITIDPALGRVLPRRGVLFGTLISSPAGSARTAAEETRAT